MKVRSYTITIIFICIGLYVPVLGQKKVQCELEKYLSLNDILAKLTFTSRINKSTEEINEQLITDIRKRKINFILTSDNEKSLTKAGGGNSLIKVIRENLPKPLEEQITLYKNFTDNYSGTIKQKKIAIEAGKEFVKRYSDYDCFKEMIDYLEKNLPILEKFVTYANDID